MNVSFGLLILLIGVGSLAGAATGNPLLVAMFDGLRPGRKGDPFLTRAGMAAGGLLAVALGLGMLTGYLDVSFAP